jgi:hypothetical protein
VPLLKRRQMVQGGPQHTTQKQAVVHHCLLLGSL